MDKLSRADVPDALIARMMGGNAAEQFGIELLQTAGVHAATS